MSSASGVNNGDGKEAALFEQRLSKVSQYHKGSDFCLFGSKTSDKI